MDNIWGLLDEIWNMGSVEDQKQTYPQFSAEGFTYSVLFQSFLGLYEYIETKFKSDDTYYFFQI